MNPNNLVDKFIYGCSHDLRSPVTSIQGLLRIADYYPHNGDIHKCLEMIEDIKNLRTTWIFIVSTLAMKLEQRHIRIYFPVLKISQKDETANSATAS
jgi:signal transduction histidine kinase